MRPDGQVSANGLLARELRIELRSRDNSEGLGVFRGRFAEDGEVERADRRHQAAHELAVTIPLHVREASGRVGVRLEKDEALVLSE